MTPIKVPVGIIIERTEIRKKKFPKQTIDILTAFDLVIILNSCNQFISIANPNEPKDICYKFFPL